eukprot:SAG22_NODE_596_length_8727_cov_107.360338_2_plen_114_part_00
MLPPRRGRQDAIEPTFSHWWQSDACPALCARVQLRTHGIAIRCVLKLFSGCLIAAAENAPAPGPAADDDEEEDWGGASSGGEDGGAEDWEDASDAAGQKAMAAAEAIADRWDD